MKAQNLTTSAFHTDNLQSNVREIGHIKLLPDFDVARWKVDRNSVIYQKADSHTLSFYLSGGETTYRADKQSLKGAPGKFCLMPQGHESRWHINGEIEFVHLYFTDRMLKQYAASNLAVDVRFIELRDLIYQDDVQLLNLCKRHFLIAHESLMNSPLLAEETLHEVMHHLLHHYNGAHIKQQNVKGGLSSRHFQMVKTRIHDQPGDKHTIEQLAQEVNLSPFHFARMFKESFGEAPSTYITRQRINAVKKQLGTQLSLAEISLLTGFSHQSHMTKNFRALTGMTPANYRQLL